MKKSVHVDISYFDMPKSFDELNKSRQNAHSIHQMVFSTSNVIANIFFFLLNVILAIKMNWFISVLVFLCLLPKYIFKKKVELSYYEFEKSQYRQMRFVQYLNSLLLNKLAAKEIRLFHTGGYILERYVDTQHKLTEDKNKFTNSVGIKDIFMNLPGVLMQIFIKIFIVFKILMKQNTIGDYSYLTGIFENLNSGIGSIIDAVSTYIGYNERIIDFKHYFMLRESQVCSGDIILEQVDTIAFNNVSFCYPDSEPVIRDVSFNISAREKVMLMGLNGSGKSTLIKLLTRFYEPSEGDIYINGLSVKEYNIDSLRAQMATVFQDFNIFSFTVRENVIIGDFNQEKNNELIYDSLKFSDFNNDEYLKSRDLDLYVNKNFESEGIELSGGQRQKLAISRAVIRNSQLIILDEPTASLDPLSESEILDAFHELYKDKTLLMVSHRLSAAIKMDKIIFIDYGKLIGMGNHGKLYEENEKYRNLFDLQASRYN